MRRWLRRILLGLLILIAVVLIVTQVVLWTDFPRRLVLSLVQRELGLRVQAASLSTGWLGHTTLRDVTLSLPLADESFFDVPEMRIAHTALIPLALRRQFELDAVTLEKPTLIVRRDQNGRWNAQDVVELVGKSLGGGPPERGTRQKPPKLPRVTLTEGTIRVIDADGRKSTIAPLEVIGYPQDPLVYRYDASVPDHFKLVGQVAAGGNWKHAFNLNAQPRDWLTPWLGGRVPDPLRVNAQWSGVINDGALVGRLVVEEAKVDHYGAQGRIAAQIGGGSAGGGVGTALLNPQNLRITTGHPIAPLLHVTSGAVRVAGQKLKLDQLRVAALGGQAQLNGDADLAARSGSVHGTWFDLTAPAPATANVRHGGDLQFAVSTPFPGRPQVSGSVTTRGKTPRGDWEGEIKIDGAGRDWADMDWTIALASASWDGKADLALQDFTIKLSQRGNMLRLADVAWPGHQVTARGEMDLKSKNWSFRFNGTDTLRTTFDFSVSAQGNAQVYTLEEMALRADQLTLKAQGAFDTREPEPVALTVHLTHVPETWLGSRKDESPVRGLLIAETKVRGTADPLRLSLKGSVRARELVAFGRAYGDIEGRLTGRLTGDDAAFTVQDLSLLGGQWHITGQWPYRGDDRLTAATTANPLRVTAKVADLSLKEMGDLLNTGNAHGTADGEWIIDIPIPRPRRDQIAARGELRTGPVAVGSSDGLLTADQIIAPMLLRNGVFRAHPVTLSKMVDKATGTATVDAQLRLAQPKQPVVAITAAAWPLRLGEHGTAAIWADAKLRIDAGSEGKRSGAAGPINVRGIVATTQQAIGELTVTGEIAGRRAMLKSITLDAIGGHAEGHAILDADAPNSSNAALTWSGIEAGRLASLIPQVQGLSGTFSGALALAPASSSRAVEPLRMTLSIDPEGEARFRTVAIGPARLSAFMTLGPDFAPTRLVLDESVEEIRAQVAAEREMDAQNTDPAQRPLAWNDIRVAGGRLRLWGRRSRHGGRSEDGAGGAGGAAVAMQTHVIADFERLDLDALVHAASPDAEPMPGRLAGRIVLHGDPRDLDEVFGDGTVRISESDLGNVDALALLYNSVALGTAPRGATGAGSLSLSLQQSTLALTNIEYFNRGVQAWSNKVTIGNVWQAPRSELSGYVVGTARPLSALKLPFLADVDAIMSVLQSNLTTVRIDGTIKDPDVSLGAFSDVGEGLQRFMRGQVTAAKSK